MLALFKRSPGEVQLPGCSIRRRAEPTGAVKRTARPRGLRSSQRRAKHRSASAQPSAPEVVSAAAPSPGSPPRRRAAASPARAVCQSDGPAASRRQPPACGAVSVIFWWRACLGTEPTPRHAVADLARLEPPRHRPSRPTSEGQLTRGRFVATGRPKTDESGAYGPLVTLTHSDRAVLVDSAAMHARWSLPATIALSFVAAHRYP